MTLDQLRIFIAVAEREHVTDAARALNLTQSATSAAIAALEQRHATQLFDRIGRRIALTPAGRMFLAEAKAVLARAAAAELMLNELAGLKRGVLTVRASQTISNYWLPRYLVAFKQAYPGIEVDLGIGNTAQVAQAVGEGVVDLGFVEGAVSDPLLKTHAIGEDRLAVVVAADYPGIGRGRISTARLKEIPWVLREPGSGTRSEFEAALRRAGVNPTQLKTVIELPSNEAIRAAVESGAGATAISELVVNSGLRARTLRRLRFDLPSRPFYVVRHRDRTAGKTAQALLALIQGAIPKTG